jgi:hypothetical protein
MAEPFAILLFASVFSEIALIISLYNFHQNAAENSDTDRKRQLLSKIFVHNALDALAGLNEYQLCSTAVYLPHYRLSFTDASTIFVWLLALMFALKVVLQEVIYAEYFTACYSHYFVWISVLFLVAFDQMFGTYAAHLAIRLIAAISAVIFLKFFRCLFSRRKSLPKDAKNSLETA